MFALTVWVLGLALEGLLLLRALRAGFIRKFALFYFYLACVLFQSLFLFVVYFASPRYYARSYWSAELLGVALGCGVVWEIYRQALGYFPGAARVASNVLLLILLTVFSKIIVDTSNGTLWWPTGAVVELERNLRAVQATVLIALVIVLMFYRVPLGRNLWGMMLGYGLFIGTSVIILALRILLGDWFQTTWQYLQPLSYLAVLCIWCTTLWSCETTPMPTPKPRIEEDYQLLAAATRKGLFQTRAFLGRAMRP